MAGEEKLITDYLLLALAFCEKADQLGASTAKIQIEIESYLERQADHVLRSQKQQ